MEKLQLTASARKRLEGRLVVASLSGGKDSTALALLLMELQLPHVRVFADTGFEAPETYAYLDVLRARLGPITVVRNEAFWKDALPGEEGMLTLIRHKRMFPSRLMRFCTQKLKLHPIRDFVRTLVDRGEEVVNAVGVRADESAARAEMPEWEFWDEMDVDIWRPLLRWSERDVIDMHHRHGLAPNPLYLTGARRVGCNPCIHARKSDLRRLPEAQLVKIRRVEQELTADAVARGCERPTRAFFQVRGKDGLLSFTPIDEVVRLAHLHRGRPIVGDLEPPGCVRWGLCESAPPEAQAAASPEPPHPEPPALPEPPPPFVTHDELLRLGVSAEMIARYCADGTSRQVGEASYERTVELDRRLAERCNVGRGYLLAVGVTSATIAAWLRDKVLARGVDRGFYTISRAAFESVRAAAAGTGLPRELEGALGTTREETKDAAPTTPPAVPAPRLRVVPCTISQARAFVDEHHRHLPAPVSGLFAVGVAQGDALVGVAIVGRPVARALQDGGTAEVTRVCTLGHRNACSMLLGACRRVARTLGYRRLVSYTLESEPGTSLRAAGWRETAAVRARSWDCPSRPRRSSATGAKRRWEVPLDKAGAGSREVRDGALT